MNLSEFAVRMTQEISPGASATGSPRTTQSCAFKIASSSPEKPVKVMNGLFQATNERVSTWTMARGKRYLSRAAHSARESGGVTGWNGSIVNDRNLRQETSG